VIPACLKGGASLTAYSPLGRGTLSGRFRNDSLGDGDWRAGNPRFQGEAYGANMALPHEIETLAQAKGCAAALIALAWLLAQVEHVLTILGTTNMRNLKTNLDSYKVKLEPSERVALELLAERVQGERYDEPVMATVYGFWFVSDFAKMRHYPCIFNCYLLTLREVL